jgi:hypothetical protein
MTSANPRSVRGVMTVRFMTRDSLLAKPGRRVSPGWRQP